MSNNLDYNVKGWSMNNIRNRNEKRVIKFMEEIIDDNKDFCGCRLCVEDVYALVMNGLPPHYVQSGAIVLRGKPKDDEEIIELLEESVGKVADNPNHQSETQEA